LPFNKAKKEIPFFPTKLGLTSRMQLGGEEHEQKVALAHRLVYQQFGAPVRSRPRRRDMPNWNYPNPDEIRDNFAHVDKRFDSLEGLIKAQCGGSSASESEEIPPPNPPPEPSGGIVRKLVALLFHQGWRTTKAVKTEASNIKEATGTTATTITDSAAEAAGTTTAKAKEVIEETGTTVLGDEEPPATPAGRTFATRAGEVADDSSEAGEANDMTDPDVAKHPPVDGDEKKRLLIANTDPEQVVYINWDSNNVIRGRSHVLVNSEVIDLFRDNPGIGEAVILLADKNPHIDDKQKAQDVERYQKALKASKRKSKTQPPPPKPIKNWLTGIAGEAKQAFLHSISSMRKTRVAGKAKAGRPRRPRSSGKSATPPTSVVVDKPVTKQSLAFAGLLCIFICIIVAWFAYLVGESGIMEFWWGFISAVAIFVIMFLYVIWKVKE
jgi:hypothetical protein